METIKGRITHATKTEAEWNKSSVVLLKGEVGFAIDTQVIKVGNGKDLWKNLKSHQGGKGDPLTIKSTANDSQGNTVVTFSDGTKVTIKKGETGGRGLRGYKGDSVTISSTTKDSQGNTVITFSDGTKTTINKGDKGDPLTFDDLTPAQIEKIKAKDVDLSNYATKDDLSKVDVSGQLADYAKKDHKHTISDVTSLQVALNNKANSNHTHDEYIKKIGVNSEGAINYTRDGVKWTYILDGTPYGQRIALKDHKHKEYMEAVGVNPDGEIIFFVNGEWKILDPGEKYKQPLAFKDHKHSIADINNLQTTLNGKASLSATIELFNELQTKLDSKASTSHKHSIADVNNLQAVLNGKASKSHTHSEYMKKGDPIELTSAQKAELKGEPGKDGQNGMITYIRYANNPSGYNMTATPQSDTTHIGIYTYEGKNAPTAPSVYAWTRIKGDPGTSITTWTGTQAQYDRIRSKSSTTLYVIKG